MRLIYLLALVGVALHGAPQPNVIVFLVDDYDKSETSIYAGNGKILTPNLDRMAREGMTFHNFHVSSTVCTPSRYSFLTGRYAGSSTFPEYLQECPTGKQGLPAFNVGLEKDNMNCGAVLAQNGYATGFVGKYHVGGHLGEDALRASGLIPTGKQDAYSETLNKTLFKNEKRYRELIKERGFTWAKNIYWGNMAKAFKGHNPEWTIKAALEFIDEHKAQPFYLHYCTTLMHGPNGEWHKSLEEKALMTGEGVIDAPLNVMPPRKTVMERINKAGLTSDEAGFLWMDDSLGMIFKKLNELGIADNTIVVFTADHGSRQKGSLYATAGTEVPCIVKWPAGIKAGSETHELAQNVDLVPTWFDLAGVSKPKGYKMDGVSMAPTFKNPKQAVRDRVYCEMGPSRAIKTKEWSYLSLRFTEDQFADMRKRSRAMEQVFGLSGGVSRGRENANSLDPDQLYRRSADPNSQKNLAKSPEYAAQLKTMKGMLLADLKRFPDRPYGEFIRGGNTALVDTGKDVFSQLADMRTDSKKKKKKPTTTKKKRSDR